MAFKMKCECGKVLTTKEENAGKRVKCPGCGRLLTVPHLADPRQAASSAAGQPSKQAGAKTVALLGAGLGAIIFLIGLFLLVACLNAGGGVAGLILGGTLTLAGAGIALKGLFDFDKET